MSPLYLGIDGGATKTKAVVIDENETVLDRGQADGSNYHAIGLENALNNLATAVREALSNNASNHVYSCLALAGIDTKEDEEIWQKAIKSNDFLNKVLIKNLSIVNDTKAAIRSGTAEKNAIVIIAGTGSNCYGRNEKGQEATSGGAGHIIGDNGSAYDIGINTLKMVAKSLDGRAGKTALTDQIFQKYKIKSKDDLAKLVRQGTWGKAEMAGVAILTDTAAKNHDKTARTILKNAASELSLMAKAVAEKLNLMNKPYTIVTTGSVFKSEIVKNELVNQVKQFSPKAQFVKQQMDTATAAAYLALETTTH